MAKKKTKAELQKENEGLLEVKATQQDIIRNLRQKLKDEQRTAGKHQQELFLVQERITGLHETMSGKDQEIMKLKAKIEALHDVINDTFKYFLG